MARCHSGIGVWPFSVVVFCHSGIDPSVKPTVASLLFFQAGISASLFLGIFILAKISEAEGTASAPGSGDLSDSEGVLDFIKSLFFSRFLSDKISSCLLYTSRCV